MKFKKTITNIVLCSSLITYASHFVCVNAAPKVRSKSVNDAALRKRVKLSPDEYAYMIKDIKPIPLHEMPANRSLTGTLCKRLAPADKCDPVTSENTKSELLRRAAIFDQYVENMTDESDKDCLLYELGKVSPAKFLTDCFEPQLWDDLVRVKENREDDDFDSTFTPQKVLNIYKTYLSIKDCPKERSVRTALGLMYLLIKREKYDDLCESVEGTKEDLLKTLKNFSNAYDIEKNPILNRNTSTTTKELPIMLAELMINLGM